MWFPLLSLTTVFYDAIHRWYTYSHHTRYSELENIRWETRGYKEVRRPDRLEARGVKHAERDVLLRRAVVSSADADSSFASLRRVADTAPSSNETLALAPSAWWAVNFRCHDDEGHSFNGCCFHLSVTLRGGYKSVCTVCRWPYEFNPLPLGLRYQWILILWDEQV